MDIGYAEDQTDIVRYTCIGDSGRGTLYKHLNHCCVYGDLTFVSQCIYDKTDRDKDVEWGSLMGTAFSKGDTDIGRYIYT